MTTSIELDEDVAAFAGELSQPLPGLVRELLVIHLYREGVISSGRSAELLGMPLLDFIQYTSKLGIPYLRMDEVNWEGEKETIRQIAKRARS